MPSDLDWQALELHLGLDMTELELDAWRGTDEGSHLKETLDGAPETMATTAVASLDYLEEVVTQLVFRKCGQCWSLVYLIRGWGECMVPLPVCHLQSNRAEQW